MKHKAYIIGSLALALLLASVASASPTQFSATAQNTRSQNQDVIPTALIGNDGNALTTSGGGIGVNCLSGCSGGGGGGAVTAASGSYVDGALATEGFTTDSACSTDIATCTEIALLKRQNQRLTSLITALGTPLQAGGSIGNTTFAVTQATPSNLQAQTTPIDGYVFPGSPFSVTANTVWDSGTSNQSLGYGSVVASSVSIGSGGAYVAYCTNDLTTAAASVTDLQPLSGASLSNLGTSLPQAQFTAAALTSYRWSTPGCRRVLVKLVSYASGTYVGTVYMAKDPIVVNYPAIGPVAVGGTPGTPVLQGCVYTAAGVTSSDAKVQNVQCGVNGAVLQRPFAAGTLAWSYAAASGGISNTTTAVTIKAANATLKNCITGFDLSAGTLGAATEVAIRDGAGGTVLWRGYLSTAGGAMSKDFMATPVCNASTNTLLEVVALTATVTGAVYFNASGYVSP